MRKEGQRRIQRTHRELVSTFTTHHANSLADCTMTRRIPSAFEDGSDNKDLKINADQSITFQEAWKSLGEKLKGDKVRGTEIHGSPPGPYVFLAKLEKDGTQSDAGQKISDWSLPGMQVNWEGNGLADC